MTYCKVLQVHTLIITRNGTCGLAENRTKHLQSDVCGTLYYQNGDRASFNVGSETEHWFSGFQNLNILFSKIVSEQPRNPLVSTPVRLVTAVDNIVYLSVLYITSLSLSVLKFILKNKLAG